MTALVKKKPAYLDEDRLLVAVDCIIFGFDGHELKALLVKRSMEPEKNKWSLLGGFVKKNESVDDAANRILSQLTGLTDIYMEQLYCFGAVHRDRADRVISIAYFALIKIADYPDPLLKEHRAQWFALGHLPASLIFDHHQMIQLAKEHLQQKAVNHPVGFTLLPHKFTLQQLQSLYEAIYESTFDKRNFTKKILALQLLHKLNEKEKQNSRKGSFLFVFHKKKYEQFQKENIRFL